MSNNTKNILRFEDLSQNSILIYDDEIQERIGSIRYLTREKEYFFDPFGGVFRGEHLKQIAAEIERLTAERNKSPFLTFDE